MHVTPSSKQAHDKCLQASIFQVFGLKIDDMDNRLHIYSMFNGNKNRWIDNDNDDDDQRM